MVHFNFILGRGSTPFEAYFSYLINPSSVSCVELTMTENYTSFQARQIVLFNFLKDQE